MKLIKLFLCAGFVVSNIHGVCCNTTSIVDFEKEIDREINRLNGLKQAARKFTQEYNKFISLLQPKNNVNNKLMELAQEIAKNHGATAVIYINNGCCTNPCNN